jgi:hypothetical protein
MYVVLARAYKRATQFAQAKAICNEAIAHGKETWGIHSILFQIAVAENDEAAIARESTWDKGKPTEYQTLDNSAFVAAAGGQLQRAQGLFHEAQAAASKQGSEDFALVINADESETERLLGALDQARASADKVPIDRDDTSFEAAVNAAFAGDTAYAKRVIEQQSKSAPASSTLVQKVQVPIMSAAVEVLRLQTVTPEAKAY